MQLDDLIPLQYEYILGRARATGPTDAVDNLEVVRDVQKGDW
jgi:hypothetical protein